MLQGSYMDMPAASHLKNAVYLVQFWQDTLLKLLAQEWMNTGGEK